MSLNTILATAPLTTTNYILKATGTTIGNSSIFDNGTNVGIGNTNTSYTLDVTGSLRATTSAYFATTSGSVGIGSTTIYNGGGFGRVLSIYETSTVALSLVTSVKQFQVGIAGTDNDYRIYDFTGSTYRFAINGSTGNVGINTTSPSTKLQVAADNSDYDFGQISAIGATNANAKLSIGYNTATDIGFISCLKIGSEYKPLALQPILGNVLIGGTTDNGYKLAVNANAATWASRIYNSNATGSGLVVVTQNTTTSAGLALYNGSSYVLYARNDGNVGIGTSAPSGKLQIEAGVSTDSAPHILLGGNGYSGFHWMNNTAYYIGQNSQGRDVRVYSGNNTAVGVALTPNAVTWTSYSDERLKTNIENFDSVLENILSLRTIKYHFKDVDEQDSQKRYGLVAQDLVGKFDEVLSKSKFSENDDTEYLGVRYTELIPVLVKAIQEQQIQIQNLQEQINILAK